MIEESVFHPENKNVRNKLKKSLFLEKGRKSRENNIPLHKPASTFTFERNLK